MWMAPFLFSICPTLHPHPYQLTQPNLWAAPPRICRSNERMVLPNSTEQIKPSNLFHYFIHCFLDYKKWPSHSLQTTAQTSYHTLQLHPTQETLCLLIWQGTFSPNRTRNTRSFSCGRQISLLQILTLNHLWQNAISVTSNTNVNP